MKTVQPGIQNRTLCSDVAHNGRGRWTYQSLLLIVMVFVAILASRHVSALQDPQIGLPSDETVVTNWIVSLQYHNSQLPSYGAIQVFDGSVVNGTAYYAVSPYFADRGVCGLLKTHTALSLRTAELWINWYLSHLNTKDALDGVPYNHYYRSDGTGETVCLVFGNPKLCDVNDATDSAAATFFTVLWDYIQAGGSQTFLTIPGRKQQIETLAATLLQLQDSDGLTWAKGSYHIKYLMDNCEVFEGLSALANLEQQVYKDAPHANKYQSGANAVQKAILGKLWIPATGLYMSNSGQTAGPDLKTWYPDMESQLWPVLCGVVGPKDPRAVKSLAALDSSWNGIKYVNWATMPQQVNGWIDADVAYSALLSGDNQRVLEYYKAVRAWKFPTAQSPGFTYPYTVGDAGWLLSIIVKLQ